MTRLSIAVVQGGPSSEAEVSRASAVGVARALTEAGHTVVRLELDAFLPESLRTGGYDVVYPVVHGAVGEDGCLQGLLEVLELPYVGSQVLASALAMNKVTARKLFALAGLPVAPGASFLRSAGISASECAERARATLGAALVVKPAAQGSAIGVTRHEADAPIAEVAKAIETAWEVDDEVLLEHFAHGREVTCGVLDLHGQAPRALPPTEIKPTSDDFYNYAAKYAPGRSVHVCPAPLGDALVQRVQEFAVRAHVALGCRDLSRVDFVVGDDGKPEALTLLEVNTLPGFTATSLYPEAAGVAGMPFSTLCELFAKSAHERGIRRKNAAVAFPG
jgi:D-alanine-D-alanine ligase